MKKCYFIFALIFLQQLLLAQTDTAYIYTFGGELDEQGRDIELTSDSGFVMVGATSSFGHGNSDIYLVKVDSNINYQWSRAIGDYFLEFGHAVKQTADNGFIICGYSNSGGNGGYDGYLVKTNDTGAVEWTKYFGGFDWDKFYDLEITPDGGFMIVGETHSFGAGGADAWVIKTDSLGNTEWEKTYGGTYTDIAHALIKTSDGNYAFCGENGSLIPDNNGDTWLVKISPSGNILFEASAKNNRTLREVAYDIIETTNKEFVITGYIESFSEGIKDVYAAKYSSNGSFLAEDAYGGRYLGNDNYDDVGFSVVESDSGYFWILGYSKSYGSGGSSDYYLFKVDPQNMNYITGTTYGENETEIGYDMIMRGSNVVMFGASNSNFSPNYYSFTLLEIFEFNRSPKYSFSEYQDSSMNTPLTILQHESDLKFRISPNPFNSFIKVNSQETIQKLKVTDISGKCLFSESTNELNMKIDLDFLQNGIYFLEITTNNSTPSILKIIKGAP